MEGKKYFTLSFDDGLEQDKRLIELLKEYKMQCTFNLNGGLFGQRGRVARIGDIGFMDLSEDARIRRALFKTSTHDRIPQDEIKDVYEDFEVASHAYRHELVSRLKAEQIIASLEQDRIVLSRILQKEVTGFAYPGGFSSKIAEECLRKMGFLFGREALSSHSFTWPENPFRYRPTCSHKDKNVFDLINDFLAAKPQNENLLFMMWGHSYEFDYETKNCSWDHIRRVFEKIAGHSDVVYCTNSEVFMEVNNEKRKF